MAARSVRRGTSLGRFLAVLLGSSIPILLLGSTASGQTDVTVRVTIEKVSTLIEHCDIAADPYDNCDFYTKIQIDGQQFTSDEIENDNSIEPQDWRYSKQVPLSKGSVPVSIQIWDGDLTGSEHIDIPPGEDGSEGGGSGQDVNLTVKLVPCSIQSGSLLTEASKTDWGDTAQCDTSLLTESYSGGRTFVTFKVEVIEPPYASSLGVRCLHSPLWPKNNQTVKVTAEAVTFGTNGNLQSRISDSIEIWVDNEAQPRKVDSGTGASLNVGPLTDSSFSYRCRVEDDGLGRSTGWRRVAVGSNLAQLYDGSAPVFYNGARRDSLDVLFHPDQKAYPGGPQSTAFMNDAYRMIWDGFLAEEVLLKNQLNYNFWIGQEFGNYDREKPTIPASHCVGVAPPYRAWSDMTVTLHKIDCRDNARMTSKGRFATTEVTDPASERVFVHEAAHALFRLADEYCCQGTSCPCGQFSCDGGYFESWPFPNVYDFESFCKRDATDAYPWSSHDLPGSSECATAVPNLGRTAANCRNWTGVDGKKRWTSDPQCNDLMVNKGRPRLLDLRRINWIFCNCGHGEC